jgi:hypothetical protein
MSYGFTTPAGKRFQIIAYPKGVRKVVASLYVRDGDPVATLTTARNQARLDNRFVDVEHNRRILATVGPDGTLYETSALDFN